MVGRALVPTEAERSVVLLFLAALAFRPVEDEDPAAENRPPLYLLRSAVADEWADVAALPAVRVAMGHYRARDRVMGRKRLYAALEALSREARAIEERTRAEAYAQHRAEVSRLLAETGRGRRMTEAEMPLGPRQPSEESAVSCRRDGRNDLDLVRLRRDEYGGADEAWDSLATNYLGDLGIEPLETLRERAAALGFDVEGTIPASWTVARRLPAGWDDGEDEDDSEPATPVAKRQAAGAVCAAPVALPEPVEDPEEVDAPGPRTPSGSPRTPRVGRIGETAAVVGIVGYSASVPPRRPRPRGEPGGVSCAYHRRDGTRAPRAPSGRGTGASDCPAQARGGAPTLVGMSLRALSPAHR